MWKIYLQVILWKLSQALEAARQDRMLLWPYYEPRPVFIRGVCMVGGPGKNFLSKKTELERPARADQAPPLKGRHPKDFSNNDKQDPYRTDELHVSTFGILPLSIQRLPLLFQLCAEPEVGEQPLIPPLLCAT